MITVFSGIAAAIFLAGFYSAVETAAYRVSPARLRHLANEGDARARRVLQVLQNLPAFLTTALIGHNVAMYSATFLLTSHLEPLSVFHGKAELWATLFLAPFGFVFAETLPKRLAYARSAPFTLAAIRIVTVSRRVFLPLGFLLGGIGILLQRTLARFGIETEDAPGRTRLAEHLDASAAEGILSESQHRMARRVMVIEALTVGDVMIPAARAFAIPESEACRSAAKAIVDAGHNQALLSDRAGQLVPRFITVNDILRNPASLDQPAAGLHRETIAIHFQTRFAKALHMLRTARVRLAVVTGKAGRPIGVVTTAGLVNCITGTLKVE